jgi:transposase-like protein
MSLIQRLLKAILPKSTLKAMEAESRHWMMRCPNCKHEHSVWEAGGIRFGAAGKPRRLLRCPNCGQMIWHEVYYKEPNAPDAL